MRGNLFWPPLLAIVGGCAPSSLVDGVPWEIRQRGTTNAASQSVRGYPCLRVNAFLLDKLADVQNIDDVDAVRHEMLRALSGSAELAQYGVNNEIDRLPESSLVKLWRGHFPDEPRPANLRKAIRERFWQGAHERLEQLRQWVMSASMASDIHRLAHRMAQSAESSPKTRHGGGPLLRLVAASIKENHGPLDRGGPLVDLYEPREAMPAGWGTEGREVRLLARYAPLIVQERLDDADYPPDTDLIGTVALVGSAAHNRVIIDTTAPSVYAYGQHTWINGKQCLQLTYTHWFPRHPRLKPMDAEAGVIEGATLRITLDANDRPAVFETVLNCGCYHRCYPAESLETVACGAFGRPLDGKRFCIERTMGGKMDWIIPETVADPDGDREIPVLFSRAGYHGLSGVEWGTPDLDNRTVLRRFTYTLRPYEELEHLPVGNGYRSMFDADGLVRGARRWEGVLMAPTGMLSAGQPRQRGTQLLHWDQYDFDDPHLLEQCLRLPGDF